MFLRQEGHISADQLVDLIRGEDPKISRATVYRTLQWMEDAGIARRVDFGEGKFKFEHSYRHPRHFHLICKSCNQSFEFLSSDIESLIEDVASARGFSPRQSVLQIYGTCQACASGQEVAPSAVPTDAVFARDALRIAVATERSGRDSHAAARITRDPRGRGCSSGCVWKRRDRQARGAVSGAARGESRSNRSRRSCFSRARPMDCSRPARRSRQGRGRPAGAADRIRASALAQIFQRYGERFEESEGRRIFLEFADGNASTPNLLARA